MKREYNVNPEQIDAQHTNGRWTAMFAGRQPNDVVGCPMGRGESYDAAVTDLFRRANLESSVTFKSA